MKFSVFAIAALAAASTSSRCRVAAAAAARNQKVQKKTSSSSGGGNTGDKCKHTSDCLTPNGLNHAVCRDGRCQSGASGSSCGDTSDCVVRNDLVPPHAVCRKGQCQRGVCRDYCGQDSDCLSPMICVGQTGIAKCWYKNDITKTTSCKKPLQWYVLSKNNKVYCTYHVYT